MQSGNGKTGMIINWLQLAGTAFLYAGGAVSAIALVSFFLVFILPISWLEGPLFIVALAGWLSGPLLIFASMLATIGGLLLACGNWR